MVVAKTKMRFPVVNVGSVFAPQSSSIEESKTDQNLLASEFMVNSGEINHAGTV
jgi:hypothetical protein